MKFKSKFYIAIVIILIALVLILFFCPPKERLENGTGGVFAAPSLTSPFQTLEIPILPTEIIERVPTEIIRVETDLVDTESRIQAILEAIRKDEDK